MTTSASNLVEHARTELTKIGEDPETIESYLKMVQAFADMGHSGGSYPYAISVLNRLLAFENLAPLTDNPAEWRYYDADMWPPEGIWQNKRNSKAFSTDGGKTYDLLDEHNARGIGPRHISQPFNQE